ncbi:LPS export ABC transporter periplasmic protein LptC [Vibrio sp. Of7-15]|uniref:LPS export ABC transporter periplasmic protein LptC n=1 Tax=Vibrio sp. Of7-15 TaxID=2724879 RepID=UPI001EF32DA3|nr:LPS export ABC transporter periplasmic protein LptC [Vibrio sp. Of7-15]MCG7498149.1 LPS export ABC transporter periplasmic protein LptC [Vibrio sp. Of7-15]
MSLARLLFILLMVVSSWAGYYLFDKQNQEVKQVIPSAEVPVFSGTHLTNTSYTEGGVRNYRIYSRSLDHYSSTGETHFVSPLLTIFREGDVTEWQISSDNAVLDNEHALLMTGNVVIHNLIQGASFESMTTDSLNIQLIEKDFMTDDAVRLFGPQFQTTGQAMRGNFERYEAKLLNKVQGRYEALRN